MRFFTFKLTSEIYLFTVHRNYVLNVTANITKPLILKILSLMKLNVKKLKSLNLLQFIYKKN